MSCRRLIVISSIALTAVVGGACGSAQPSGQSSTATTTPKLKLAATGTSATSAADGAAPAIYPAPAPAKYVLDGTLADLGAKATVLRLNAVPVNEADVRRFADALGVTGSPTRTAGGWAVQSTDAILTVDTADGAARISYSHGVPTSVGASPGSGVSSSGSTGSSSSDALNGTKPEPVPTTPAPPALPVDVPNAADAKTIAQTLLDHMGVLAGQKWSIAATDGADVAVSSCPAGIPCPMAPPETVSRTVTFALQLDNGPIDGIDWSVTIGQHRRIESVYGEWSSPVTIGSYPLRSTAAVFVDLQDGTARYPGVQAMATDLGGGATEPAIAADTPAAVAPTEPGPSVDPPTKMQPAEAPAAVTLRITGVSLGLARWSAVDRRANVVDLVPTYNFHVAGPVGTTYDIAVLALEPSAITFG